MTSSATPANRHFQSYSQTGNDVDIAEPTRLTPQGKFKLSRYLSGYSLRQKTFELVEREGA